ncbi:hypothetical protein F5Y00DRAFT_264691 [Daldinia vernicosa]|uniref:uncharacterized protein n=1 Tax=Daldinia vernicosa TaxID=114800 RepID=UPI0020087AE2|nr:uncharacterized protein F5Y00DRAFT_264691 [Daldinia vernicosa]KAI0846310.1 hypothetical protein F5Y00DRAFT_264691 [Daldinia vernicosa]
MAKLVKDFADIIDQLASWPQAKGHDSKNYGNDNGVFQFGSGHKSENRGDSNKVAQEGSNENSKNIGNKNGTAQFGAENIAKMTGDGNRAGQRGRGNESTISRHNYSSTLLGVDHKHDSKDNPERPSFSEGGIEEYSRDGSWVLKWDLGWAWDLAWKWVSGARD